MAKVYLDAKVLDELLNGKNTRTKVVTLYRGPDLPNEISEVAELSGGEGEPSEDALEVAQALAEGFEQLAEQTGLPTAEQVWVSVVSSFLAVRYRDLFLEHGDFSSASAMAVESSGKVADLVVAEYKKRFIEEEEKPAEEKVEPRKKKLASKLDDGEESAPIVLPTQKRGD